MGPGLALSHLHHHPLGPELCLLCRPGALVVRGHKPHRCLCVGPRAEGLGPRHVRIGCLVFAVREHFAEDVQEGRWWVVCRPLRGGGGIGGPDSGSPPREGAGCLVICGPVWASCLVLVGQMSVRRASCVPVVCNRLTRASRHPGLSVGRCSNGSSGGAPQRNG